MKIPFKIQEYVWLIEPLRKRPLSFAELNDKWVDTELSGGVEMARSTFNRHKQAIEDMFGVYIECDVQNGYQYYIAARNPVVAGSEAHLFMHKIDVVPRTVVGGVPAKFIKNL